MFKLFSYVIANIKADINGIGREQETVLKNFKAFALVVVLLYFVLFYV